MGVYFYPRGGSAHVCRALATEFERNGSEVTVLSGSRSDLGEHALASSFYSGLDLRAVDFTPALRSGDPLRFDGAAGTAPMHGSYEDRPGAEDPVLASLDDEAYELQVEAWARELRLAGRRRRRPPLPAPPDPAQRGGGARVPGDPGARPRPRHRAADAGADRRRRPGELDARRALGRADLRLGGRLRADGRQRPRGRRRAAAVLDLDPDRFVCAPNGFDPGFAPARGRPPLRTGAATWSSVRRAGGPGRRRAASPTRRPTSSRWTGRCCSTSGRFTEVKRLPLLIEAYARARPRFADPHRPGPARRLSRRVGGGAPDRDDRAPRAARTSSSPAGTPTTSCPTSSTPPTSSSTPRSTSSSARCWSRRWPAGCRRSRSTAAARPTIVDDPDTGWLVPPDDVDALAAAMVEAVNDAAGRRAARPAGPRARSSTATPGSGSASTSPSWRASCPGSGASGGSKKDRAGEGRTMPEILIGPLLRYVSETEATVWVETDEACEVEVLGRSEPTFGVDGHHYALVRVEGLEPARVYEYEVALDGERRWPEPGLGAAAERDPHPRSGKAARHLLRLLPGRAAPRAALHGDRGRTRRRLRARRALGPRPGRWSRDDRDELARPALPARRPGLRRRGHRPGRASGSGRGGAPARRPGEEVIDFEEYTWLYQRELARAAGPLAVLDRLDLDALGRPRHERRLEHLALLARGDGRKAWWHGRAVGGIISYWIYQHLGNLSPRELDENEIYAKVRGNQQATRCCVAWAERIDSTGVGHAAGASAATSAARGRSSSTPAPAGARPRAALDVRRRGVGVDRRPGQRRLRPPADRDHGALPALARLPSARGLERAGLRRRLGRPGGAGAREAAPRGRLRPLGLLPARSARCATCSARSAPAGAAQAPASIVVLSGDVHHAYLCEVGCPAARPAAQSTVYQAVCSPYRNPLDEQGAAGDQGRLRAPLHAACRGPGPAGRRAGPRHPLAPARRPLLRQPGRDPPPRRAPARRCGSTRPSPARRTRPRWRSPSNGESPSAGRAGDTRSARL